MILSQVIRIVVLTTISFLVALSIAPIWIRLLKRWKFGKQIRTSTTKDSPVFLSLHRDKEGIPTAGGVLVWGTALGLAGIFFVLNWLLDGVWEYFDFVNRAQTYLPLAALGIAAVFGLFDDWVGALNKVGRFAGGFRVRYKIITYTFMAAIGAWWFYARLGWDVLHIPFVGNVEIGLWYVPLFMFIIIASAFSANETDGLDGLLGGVSLFAFIALAAVAFVLGRYDLAAFNGVMIGALLAFLWFNIYPARFFMGDTGSMALGITIGVTAMLTNTALLLPFFFIIPVIESLSVIVQMASKWIRKKKIFHSTPIHHHFEALGWPESQVTMRFWIISAVSVALGLVLFFIS